MPSLDVVVHRALVRLPAPGGEKKPGLRGPVPVRGTACLRGLRGFRLGRGRMSYLGRLM